MRIQKPGSEVCRAYPPKAPEEEQARFYFRTPNAHIGRRVLRLALNLKPEEFFDVAQKTLGLLLTRVENLHYDDGEEITIEKKGDQLTEETLSALRPMLKDLMEYAADLCRLKGEEQKNSGSPQPNISDSFEM